MGKTEKKPETKRDFYTRKLKEEDAKSAIREAKAAYDKLRGKT